MNESFWVDILHPTDNLLKHLKCTVSGFLWLPKVSVLYPAVKCSILTELHLNEKPWQLFLSVKEMNTTVKWLHTNLLDKHQISKKTFKIQKTFKIYFWQSSQLWNSLCKCAYLLCAKKLQLFSSNRCICLGLLISISDWECIHLKFMSEFFDWSDESALGLLVNSLSSSSLLVEKLK